ncbi:MAG: hypothetical protein JXA36_00470 [Coriobacteriia bacterium]|nr:hypothetical protein [Coriobacteriia bacterium]
MATRSRWPVLATLALLLVVGAVAFFSLTAGDGDSPKLHIPDVFLPKVLEGDGESEGGSALDPETGEPVEETSTPEDVAARKRRYAVKDTPAIPDEGIPPQSSSPHEITDDQSEYLEETRRNVQSNPDAVRAMVAAIVEALSARDAEALADFLAPDEGSQTTYIEYIAERYPPILTSAPGCCVNIFTVNDATIYIAYSQLQWRDAGLISEHTIPVAMRYVDGRWYLTSLDDATPDLRFVQLVQVLQ